MDTAALLPQIIQIAQEAGKAILAVYNRPESIQVQEKADQTPVTEADLAAHRLIQASLERLTPDIPVLSEESAEVPYDVRRNWKRYWLVDPLDGTREFLKRNGEFTVNIALVEEQRAVLGVVMVPVSGTVYAGSLRLGAFKRDAHGREQPLATRAIPPFKALTLVSSRSHRNERQQALVEQIRQRYPVAETQVGSSLKLCLIAEGLADLCPRLGPTSEWDTAAAHAILEAAGGQVLDRRYQPLRYNSKASLLNPDFYALGDPDYPWAELLEPGSSFNDTAGIRF